MEEAKIRSFLAIELSQAIQAELDAVTRKLKSTGNLPVKWVPGKNIHLTLKFLGESDPAQIKKLEKALKPPVCKHIPFEFTVGGLGAFPSVNKPRVVWVGVQAPEVLTSLQKVVEDVAFACGYPREDRPFSAHLTLGRVGQYANPDQVRQISDAFKELKVGVMGTMRVEAIALIKSVLTPAGSIYTPISSFPFSC